MYHEVFEGSIKTYQPYKMTPMYYMPAQSFEEQMLSLSNKGYKSIVFDDVRGLEPNGDYVIITFDDGLIGNAKVAAPILKKYGFKAIFFVTVGSIGSPGYMDWADLRELIDGGMSIQSHTMNHRPLQTLSDKEIYSEAQESKELLEKILHINVAAMSFPHGSYNQKIIRIVGEAGYKFLCTSEVIRNYDHSFQKKPTVLGRITVTNKLNINRFIKNVTYSNVEFARQKLMKKAKNTLKNTIGIETYRRLYRKFLRIELS